MRSCAFNSSTCSPWLLRGHLLDPPVLRTQYCQRGIETDAGSPWTGLAVISAGGVCFGLMSPFMFIATSALATTNGWRILPYGCASFARLMYLRPCVPAASCMRQPQANGKGRRSPRIWLS